MSTVSVSALSTYILSSNIQSVLSRHVPATKNITTFNIALALNKITAFILSGTQKGALTADTIKMPQ